MSTVPIGSSPQDARPEAERRMIIREIVRQVGGSTSMVAGATSIAIPVGIVSAIITVHYLRPSQYGQLALLMVYSTFLTVMYNVGLLHGTFLWVYGSSGEGSDDLEIEGLGRSGVSTQRAALGTGMFMTLIVVAVGTAVFFIFRRPTAELILGSAHGANLVGWAALSGGAGSIYRLACNVFRFERRQRAFAFATVARPLGILGCSTALLVAGYGEWGAVVGSTLPTIVCALGCMLFTRRNYALAFSFSDARSILIRGGAVVIPVVMLFVLHSADVYILAAFTHGAAIGVYRLASRLGSPPSYFASAFIMTWSPLERSALVSAAFAFRGRQQVRTVVITYYLLVGVTIVVMFVLFSRVFLLVAPRSYAEAAKLVPLVALAFVGYGAYIMLLRTTHPTRLILWYTITSILAAITFIGSSFLLIPAIGAYGVPLGLTIGMAVGWGIILYLNTKSLDPLPVEYGRIGAGFAVGAVVSGVALAGARAGQPYGVLAALFGIVTYFPALIWTRAIPPSHLPMFRSLMTRGRSRQRVVLSPNDLPDAEREALERFRQRQLHKSHDAIDYARLVRALRRLGGIGSPSMADSRIGLWVASPEPEAVRDFQLHALIAEGIDAFDLHNLDDLARAVRSGNELAPKRRRGVADHHAPKRSHARKQLRARAHALEAREHEQLAHALGVIATYTHGRGIKGGSSPSSGSSTSPANGHDNGGPTPRLALVRAVREVRDALGVGSPTASDLTLAQALCHPNGHELTATERDELQRIKDAVKLSSRSSQIKARRRTPDGGLDDQPLPPEPPTTVESTIEEAPSVI